MKTSEQSVLQRPRSEEAYLVIGNAFESKGVVVAANVPVKESARAKPTTQSAEAARQLRVWASQQLAATQTAEGLVFQLLLASGVVLIVISFWV